MYQWILVYVCTVVSLYIYFLYHIFHAKGGYRMLRLTFVWRRQRYVVVKWDDAKIRWYFSLHFSLRIQTFRNSNTINILRKILKAICTNYFWTDAPYSIFVKHCIFLHLAGGPYKLIQDTELNKGKSVSIILQRESIESAPESHAISYYRKSVFNY